MKASLESGNSTLAALKAAAESAREARAEPVKLPSGVVVRLIKLTQQERLYLLGSMKGPIDVVLNSDGKNLDQVSEATIEMAQRVAAIIHFIFFEPRVPEEASPVFDIPAADIAYALAWSREEISDSGGSSADSRLQ